jgi:methionyl-tRNA synthetase
LAEHFLVAVAWPYANGSLHMGHIAGCFLPADIFARYQRLKGNKVLMVSGSDQHGAPITLRAENEHKTPQEIVDTYHHEFLDCWEKLGISFDLFTNTGTANHASVVHDIFLKLLEKGYLYKEQMPQAYCEKCKRFLPDRYVEGTCPRCGFTDARGDQCDKCGNPLNPGDLINFRCKLCNSTPRFEKSEHFFLKLSAFEDRLKSWVKEQTHWRANVQKFTLGLLEEGLKDRAITRDLDWGVTVPQPGFENKRIYVWFEAVIGYLSACKEWAHSQPDINSWQQFWNKDVKSYYFIGKDNIPFHTIIWPSMLMGYGGLHLPDDVPSNEFLTIEGKKISTSRNWAVWVPDYIREYAPDPLRYVLSINMPETSDTDFSWHEYFRRNNDELVATYGNLANRILTFTQRNFEGIVPEPGQLDDYGRQMMDKAAAILESVGQQINTCRFKEGLKLAMALAQEANRYIDEKAPWKVIKQNRQNAAQSIYVSLAVLSALKTVLYPYLPFTSQNLHTYLGFDGIIESGGWSLRLPVPGNKLPVPQPLFTKLDDSMIEKEMARLGKAS